MSFFRNGRQEGKTGSIWGVGTSGKGEDIRKWFGRVTIEEILCTHV
jgi:hypothetical protein